MNQISAVEEVKIVLGELLKDGVAEARQCRKAIEEETGITSDVTILKARRELGVGTIRRGYGAGGKWIWFLLSKGESLGQMRAKIRLLFTGVRNGHPSMPEGKTVSGRVARRDPI